MCLTEYCNIAWPYKGPGANRLVYVTFSETYAFQFNDSGAASYWNSRDLMKFIRRSAGKVASSRCNV